MQAVQLDHPHFSWGPVPHPGSPGPGYSLVRVQAAGLNFPDVLQARGLYPAPKGSQPGLGLEVAGTVVSGAPSDTGDAALPEGTRVMGLTNGGGLGEYVLVPTAQLIPTAALIPDGSPPPLDAASVSEDADGWVVAAASVPESGLTAWANLVHDTGAAAPGGVCLVHGAAGGVGSAAAFVARRRGCAVVGTATRRKARAAIAAGADMVIDYRNVSFRDVLRNDTVASALRQLAWSRIEAGNGAGAAALPPLPHPSRSGAAVTAVLDIIGGDYVQSNMAVCAPGAKIVSVAFQSGSKPQGLDLMPMMLKRLTLTGSTLRSRSPAEKAALMRGFVGDGTAGALLRRDAPPPARDPEAESEALLALARAVSDAGWTDAVDVRQPGASPTPAFVTEAYKAPDAAVAYGRLESGALIGKCVLVLE